MATFNILKEDLFSSEAPVIGHGVNCQGVMGAGIAKAFKGRYPDMYTEYRKECFKKNLQPGKVFLWPEPAGPMVANLATQILPGPNASVGLIAQSLTTLDAMLQTYTDNIQIVAIPAIGCGIGGLDLEDDLLPVLDQITLHNYSINLHLHNP